MNTFGEKIVTYRKRLGMNQRTLAERSYLDPSHLNRIEKGVRKPPAIENLLQMATTLRALLMMSL